ncbi:MAG: DNA topoisomerase IB [Kiritimatiellia bacterium]|jgi:DNA topoisomerase-1|nr:DNA topoisomerase IB [Kiritimatiellia bacterium]
MSGRAVKLHFSSDHDPGYHRKPCGRGFVYLGLRGKRLTGQRTLRRIQALAIPPAWVDVWICSEPSGHLQATGCDAAGRKQYRYHPQWEHCRRQTVFAGLGAFAAILPRIRRRVTRDLAGGQALNKKRVLALTVRLLDQTLMRIGHEEYTERYRSHGLTTLRDRHVRQDEEGLRIRFKGKGGKTQHCRVDDDALCRLILGCEELPGQELFQYRDSDGNPVPVRSEDVNAYLQEASGQPVTAKVFRTWGATAAFVRSIAESLEARTAAERKRQQRAAVKAAATRLQNTPAVTRQSYIHPRVLEEQASVSLHKRLRRRRRSDRRGMDVHESIVARIVEGG